MTDRERMAGEWLAEARIECADLFGHRCRDTTAIRAITAAYNKGRADMREELAERVYAELDDPFLSDNGYATGQPISSIAERVGSDLCATAIRAIPVEGE